MTKARFFRDLIKYFNYTFESASFVPNFEDGISPQSREVALGLWPECGPAIMIHGIMPRSGTVYAGELLRLHPDLHAYPYQLWESPFLQLTGDLLKLQRKFFLLYEQNVGKIGEHDFVPLFGAALVAYLHAGVPPGRRMLLKVPSVQYLSRFHAMFPGEHLLVLVRDGRDVVHSTLRTWPQLRFVQVCLRWNRAARMVLAVHQQMSATGAAGYWLARYEDALDDPVAFVREACQRFELDAGCYPYAQIDAIPVHGSSELDQKAGQPWQAVRRPPDFRPTGYWRGWSPWRKWLFKRIAGKSLLALGYCEDLNW